MSTDSLLVVVKKSAEAGPYGILLHCSKPRCRNGAPETSIADRLVHFEVGGNAFCEMVTPPRSPKLLTKIIAGAYKGGTRSKYAYRQVVLSVADTPENRHEIILSKLKLAVDDYRAKYLSGCPAWAAFYHADKSHVHCHIIACNWDDVTNSLLNWSRRDIIQMNSLRWYAHGDFTPGANLYKRAPLEKRPRVYTKAATDIRGIVEEIKRAPDWKEDLPYRLKVLEAKGIICPYETEGGKPGFIFNGRKVTLAKINYELRTAESVYIGSDGLQYNAAPVERTDVEQQTVFDAQLGATDLESYKRFQDLPAFKLSDSERREMMSSRVPDNTLYRRHARTAVMRRAMFADACDDLDLTVKPCLKAFEALLGGRVKTMQTPGTFISFVAEVLAAAHGAPNLRLLLAPVKPAMDAAMALSAPDSIEDITI